MKKEINNKPFITWIEEFWEEFEIQFYGITGAIFFFFCVYAFFHPSWMGPLIDYFKNIKMSL